MSAEEITEKFRQRLTDFAGLNAMVTFDFGDEGSLTIDANESPPSLSEGDGDGDSDVTIRMSITNLEKLVAGDLNPTLAYAMGKLKIEGSMGLAMKVAALLDED